MPCIEATEPAAVPEGPEEAGCGTTGIVDLTGIVYERLERAVFEEVDVEGCGTSEGMTLEVAVLEELDGLEAFLACAGTVEGPLSEEGVERMARGTSVVAVRKMLGEWRCS